MPTYDYRCNACGHEFEKFHSITADPIKNCPDCGENKVERLISSGGGVIFVGDGFYGKDYNDKYKEDKKRDEERCPITGETQAQTKKKVEKIKEKTKKNKKYW